MNDEHQIPPKVSMLCEVKTHLEGNDFQILFRHHKAMPRNMDNAPWQRMAISHAMGADASREHFACW